jgi:hypothetical protein
MKIVGRIVVGLIAVPIVIVLLQGIASETGEVAVLYTTDATGGDVTTRVWVVDHDGAQWLRAGQPESAWYVRLAAQPAVRVERNDVISDYVAVPMPDQRAVINDLMRQKYGWRDALIGVLVGGRDRAIAIRLDAREAASEEMTVSAPR